MESIGSEGQIMRKYYQRRLPEDPMKDYYFIHRLTGQTQPLLVEYGFIDNANDAEKLQNNLLNYVEAVVRALARYAGYDYVPPVGSGEYYTVQKDDSLWSIARKFGVTVAELKEANNLTSDILQVGQLLKIPQIEEETPGLTETTYVVQRNDSLWSIANRFGTTVAELKRINNLTSDELQIGQILKLSSGGATPPSENTTYIVKSGDSLWSIANKLETTVDELKRVNNLTSNLLQIGQVLIVPQKEQAPSNPTETIYIVVSGDSLWSIANRFGVTVNDIITANNLTSNVLNIGQQLIIPTENNQTIYTVQRNDSLWSIANRFGTTVSELKRINNLTTDTLDIGQQLIIPN